ncbi:MAG: flavin reductase family protein [Candidatus Aminicenantes bacterium]
MRHIEPKDLPVAEVFSLLLGGVSPRPIALVATISGKGEVNLAPFSFFNVFGANPPTVAFSPSTRIRDGSRKDTYYNLNQVSECTIQSVSYDMVEQVNLASTQYEAGVDEFAKSGLTPIPSDLVRPPRVKESPFQMECILERMIALGEDKGSGNLMICRVVKFHIAEEVFAEKGIDPQRIDLVGRNGADFYTRASGSAIFEVEKPLLKKGIGYDQLPVHIKESHVFTANNLAKLANVEKIPAEKEVRELIKQIEAKEKPDENVDLLPTFERFYRLGDYEQMLSIAVRLKKGQHPLAKQKIELAAKVALEKNDKDFAWKAALFASGGPVARAPY